MLKSAFKTVADFFVYCVVRVVVCLLQAVTIETCVQLAKFLAWLAYDVLKVRRNIIDDNLAHALPHLSAAEREKIGRGFWEHLVTMCCELMHAMRKLHDSNYRKFVTVVRKREMVGALLDPRPLCLVTGHFGNFEMGGYVTGVLGLCTHTIARTLDNRFIDRFLLSFRESKLQYILPKVGSAPQADLVLQTGGTLVLLGDQNAGTRGCKVNFLNRLTHCHKALALFTLVSGAPMMVSYSKRRGKAMQFEVGMVNLADPKNPGPELSDAKALSQWYMDNLATVILQSPEQYWWVHRLWRDAKDMKVNGKTVEKQADPVSENRPARGRAARAA